MSLKKGSTLSMSVQARPDSLTTPLDLDSKPKDFSTIKDLFEPPKPGQAFQTYDATEVAFPGLRDRWVKKAEETEKEKKNSISSKSKEIKKIWSETQEKGQLLHLTSKNKSYDGRLLLFNNEPHINFGSCGYFGLEINSLLKQGAINAIKRFGSQFAFPTVFMKTDLYEELEKKYLEILGYKIIIASSVTHAHLSAIPIISETAQLFILDQQVHTSVQMAVEFATKRSHIKVKIIPHNNLEQLEKILKNPEYQGVETWYFADGIYSMFGDLCPIKELKTLQKTYKNLHLYIDDAHGMSLEGENGKGYALNNLENLDKTLVTVSHAKCFGTAGGTIILDNEELHNKIKNFGPTMIFSGPMQPALLGASNASADLHLTKEITTLQKQFKKNVYIRNLLTKHFQLPAPGTWISPIMFLEVGDHRKTGELVRYLFSKGFYVNPALYPAVGKKSNGIRITTTCLQTEDDIYNLLSLIAKKIKLLQLQ